MRGASRTLRAVGHAAESRWCATATQPDKLRSAFNHCLSQLREHDYPNYVWAIQSPKVWHESEA